MISLVNLMEGNDMGRLRRSAPLMRAIGVISALGIITTGVTFAALQSQSVALTGNAIKSATASLEVGTSPTSFSTTSRAGFDFTGLVPGGSAQPETGDTFYLKNNGTAALNITTAVSSVPVNLSSVDLTKVHVQIMRVDTSSSTQTFTLSDLINANTTGGVALTDPIAANTVAQYNVKAFMDIDAFTGSSASITGIDLTFNGAAVVQ